MSESSKFSLTTNATVEGAALALLYVIADCEQKVFATGNVDRAWVLDTYTECLQAARYERRTP